MEFQNFPPHIRFAFAVAFSRLEQLVWYFNIDYEMEGRAYVGIYHPAELIIILDEFLRETPQLLGGDVVRLKKMRDFLKNKIISLYEMGENRASSKWGEATLQVRRQLIDFGIEDVCKAAKDTMPRDLSSTESGWYIEGFCRRWWEVEYIKYLQNITDSGV